MPALRYDPTAIQRNRELMHAPWYAHADAAPWVRSLDGGGPSTSPRVREMLRPDASCPVSTMAPGHASRCRRDETSLHLDGFRVGGDTGWTHNVRPEWLVRA
jgi:hypothetical protein